MPGMSGSVPGTGGPGQSWKIGALAQATGLKVPGADAHHARAVQARPDIIEEPADQPDGVREYGARDLEGQLWYFHSALE